MTPDAIPVKTDQARQILRSGEFAGTRAQRALLIMVDGHKTVGRLTAAMTSLGLSAADLQKLADAGLVDWLRRERGRGLGHRRDAFDKPMPVSADVEDADTVAAPQIDVAMLMQGTRPADFDDDPASTLLPIRSRVDIEL
jgi:hypothetical protein